jgi:small subunit ribosomal protein S8
VLTPEKGSRSWGTPATDPIADLLTRIRNAQRANHDQLEVPGSKVKLEIVKILAQERYIKGYEWKDDDKQGYITVFLKYGPRRERVITDIQRVSKPGIRVYKKTTEIPRVLNGMGMAIISTSRGLMPDREARRQKLGGEVICTVW